MGRRKIPARLPLDTAHLKTRREHWRMTQDDLARAMHVNRFTVMDWESGARDVYPETLYLLSCVLKCSMNYLLPDDWQ